MTSDDRETAIRALVEDFNAKHLPLIDNMIRMADSVDIDTVELRLIRLFAQQTTTVAEVECVIKRLTKWRSDIENPRPNPLKRNWLQRLLAPDDGWPI